MKLHTTREHIERGGVRNESAFTIKTTAKAFDILSSGLYTDPIAAVIRELSCNAYDAHVAAGKADTPFDLHLPNQLEPFFSVVDYGVGLSDEQIQGQATPVMREVENDDGEIDLVPVLDDEGNQVYTYSGGLYTTYFDSTKSDSNDFIGALGLGSKSPFSYTSAFDVISRHNGTKSVYSIFLNEDGIPTVAMMGQTQTDESNGLEVRLAIEEKDFHRFESTAASILRYFPVKPIVKGAMNFSFIELPEHRIGGDGWFVARQNWSSNSFTAVQGNVPYRVDVNQLDQHLDDAVFAFLRKTSIVAYFEIGELDVAANREEIRYDDGTKAALSAKVQLIREDLIKELEAEADKYTDCFWDACINLSSLSANLFGQSGMIRTFVSQNGTRNETLRRYIRLDGDVRFTHLRGHDVVRYTDRSNWKRKRTVRDGVHSTIRPESKTIIFYNDVKNTGIGRIKNFLYESTDYHSAIAILPRKEPSEIEGEPFEGYDKELERLIDELGNPKINYVSETTKPIKRSTGSALPFYKFGGVENKSQTRWQDNYVVNWNKLDEDDIDISEGGLYFFIKHQTKITVTVNGVDHVVEWAPKEVKAAFENIITLINEHLKTDYTFADAVGVTTKTRKKLEKESNWKDIFDLFRSIVPNFKDGVEHVASMRETPDTLGLKNLLDDATFLHYVESLDVDSTFRQTVEPMLTSHKRHSEQNRISNFVLEFDKYYGDRRFVDSGKEFFDSAAFEKYPMLSFVGTLRKDGQDWAALFDYIKLIDRS